MMSKLNIIQKTRDYNSDMSILETRKCIKPNLYSTVITLQALQLCDS